MRGSTLWPQVRSRLVHRLVHPVRSKDAEKGADQDGLFGNEHLIVQRAASVARGWICAWNITRACTTRTSEAQLHERGKKTQHACGFCRPPLPLFMKDT